MLVLFLHNSYGTPEFSNCENLVGTDLMENMMWGDTDPSMHFRETNTDPSMHFRKAIMDPPMHFKKANTEFFIPILLSTLFTISLPSLLPFTPIFNHNITTNVLHHNKYNVICLLNNSKLSPLYSLCFIHSFIFCSKVASLKLPANGTGRKRPTH